MTGRRRAAALAAAGALALGGELAAADPAIEVRAALAPDPVGRDELAILTLTVQTSGLGLPRVEPGFLLENLEGAGGPSRSQSTSWINGQSSSRLELTWRLRPLAVGRARVHAFRVEIGQEIRSLADLAIEVVEQAPPGRAAPRAGPAPADPFARLFDDDPFGVFPRRRRDEPMVQPKLAVRSLVEPTNPYVGEQVVWTLALDTQTDISGFRPQSLPDFAGFWSRELEVPQPPRPTWIEIDGEKYGRVPMHSRALFPLRPGELQVERIPVEVLARMADTEWIGRLGRDQRLEVVARPVGVRARPLPPAPPGFSGLVGQTTISARLEPRELAAGQAATLTVTLTTSGNPGGVEPPRPKLPAGLRGFPPETASEERQVGGRLESHVEWRFVVLADAPGSYEIPALDWITFDPRQKAFVTASTSALSLAVAPSSTPAAAAARERPGETPVAPELASQLAGRSLALALVVAAAAIGLAVWSRRRRTATRPLRGALDAARRIESPREAAKAIDAAWRHLLAERYGVGRGTPSTQWPEALARAGWRPEAAVELQQLFEELHLLEFAPELADADALRHDVDRRSRELARRLR